MREDELRRLMTVAAEDVRPSHSAAAGWERARRTRHARRAAAGVVLAVTLLTAGTVLALRPTGAPTRPATPTASPIRTAEVVQKPPVELSYPGDPLGRLTDPVSVPLSTRPVRRALALYQPIDRETYTGGVVRVLGDDGVVRSLDVVTLNPTRDAGGNEAPALKPGQLSPDGRTAVFPQTGGLIVVDLTTAAVRRVKLDGYLELAVWSGDRVLVGGDDGTYFVNPISGAASRVTVSAWEVLVPDPATVPEALVELSGVRDGIILRSRSARDGNLRGQHPVSSTALPLPYRINEFYGRGWQRGDLVARAAWIKNPQIDGAEAVVVLDARTGEVTRLLDLGRDGRSKLCCEVLGRTADGGVLFRTSPGAGGSLVRWQPETGEVIGVVPTLAGAVALPG